MDETLRVPAEFEPQDAIWLSWPTYENKRGLPVEDVHASIIKALSSHVQVHVLVENVETQTSVLSYLHARGVPIGHITFVHMKYGADIWMRDFGPYFVRRSSGTERNLEVVSFRFNCWGYESEDSDTAKQMYEVAAQCARHVGVACSRVGHVSEGGSRETNGDGVMILCEAVEKHRNPGCSREDIEKRFRDALGMHTFIWMESGVVEDDHASSGPITIPDGRKVYPAIATGGHTDEFVRFVSKDTVLLGEVTEFEARRCPLAAETRRRMERNFEILRQARGADGKPFNIVRVPFPETLVKEVGPGDGVYDYLSQISYRAGAPPFPKGENIWVFYAASYLNFLVSNGVVVMPRYYRPGRFESIRSRDEWAQTILQTQFPSHDIVAIDVDAINLGGGGIHCVTMQQPSL
eukprot:Rmarinus@m.4409